MKQTTPSKVTEVLKIDYSEPDKIALSNQDTLRKLVGLLGMLLPLLLFIGVLIDNGMASPLPSISHYYFTRSAGILVIIVSLLAIFLLVYKGREPIDFYISSIAGIFALCLLLFPTNNLSQLCCQVHKDCDGFEKNYVVTLLHESNARMVFHYVASGIFLGCLAIMALFLFTRYDKTVTGRNKKMKEIRNGLYRTCGIIMLLAILIILAGFLGWINDDFYNKHNLTFWMETVAVESFGLSWLVKGGMFLQ